MLVAKHPKNRYELNVSNFGVSEHILHAGSEEGITPLIGRLLDTVPAPANGELQSSL